MSNEQVIPAHQYVNVKEPIMSGVVAEHGMTIWVDDGRDVLCIGVYQTDDYICFGGNMPYVFAQMVASYGEQRTKKAALAQDPEAGQEEA